MHVTQPTTPPVPARDSTSAEPLVAPVPREPIEVADQRLQLFDESGPLIEAMARDIRQARQRVWLESYIVADDAAGREIATALKDRARAGVPCRLMYDALGSNSTPARFFDELREAGVEVHCFHQLFDAFFRRSFLKALNQRNHRKLLIVDHDIAYFGGMNVVDQSGIADPADAHARRLPVSAGWRDVHVRMSGPKQSEVATAFDRLWRKKNRLPSLRGEHWPVDEMLTTDADGLWFFASQPNLKLRRPARVFAPLMRLAKRSITLSMAYFIPEGQVLKELLRARKRGVKVRVIVPGQSDVPVVHWATRHMYDKLLRRGIIVYERQDQMLHSKVMTVDGAWSVIGSCNLDPRSLRWNLEFLSVVRSQSLAAAVEAICDYEMRHSRRARLKEQHARGWWRRTLDWLAWSMRRWL